MSDKDFIPLAKRLTRLAQILTICVVGGAALLIGIYADPFGFTTVENPPAPPPIPVEEVMLWQAPDSSSILDGPEGDLIRYGRDLIAHTSVYLGPKGKIKSISNGMNCQNCHIDAGTKPYGNNFGKAASTYPKLRNRSGMEEGFEKRVNDCIERSLNGQKLEENSLEMRAMVAYIKWVGKDVDKETKLPGLETIKLTPLDRAADPIKGSLVYKKHCVECHGADGNGQMAPNGLEWIYPPLFGENSYNTGAGLYRLSHFSSYVKTNMPYGVTHENPILTDEEAWDVAAYVNSLPRPEKDLSKDWPDISKKPFDHPFGPYTDSFPEEQHKYGPFLPIISYYDNSPQ